MWWNAIPGIIDKALGLVNTLLNPEDTRKRKLAQLRKREREILQDIKKQLANKKRDPVTLGAAIDELVQLRRQIDRHTR